MREIYPLECWHDAINGPKNYRLSLNNYCQLVEAIYQVLRVIGKGRIIQTKKIPQY